MTRIFNPLDTATIWEVVDVMYVDYTAARNEKLEAYDLELKVYKERLPLEELRVQLLRDAGHDVSPL